MRVYLSNFLKGRCFTLIIKGPYQFKPFVDAQRRPALITAAEFVKTATYSFL